MTKGGRFHEIAVSRARSVHARVMLLAAVTNLIPGITLQIVQLMTSS